MSEMITMTIEDSSFYNKSLNRSKFPSRGVIFKMILYIFSGQLLSLFTINEQFIRIIKPNIAFDNIFQTMLPSIILYSVSAAFLFFLCGRIPKPKLIFMTFGVLYVAIDFIGKYCYSKAKADTKTNSINSIEYSQVITLFFLLVYHLINKKIDFSRKRLIGLNISGIALLITLCMILFKGNAFNFELFKWMDMINIIVGIVIGLLSSILIYLQEKYLKTKEDIYNALFWLSIEALFLWFLILMCFYSSNKFSDHFDRFDTVDYYKFITSISLQGLSLFFIPFFIMKCTSLMISLCLTNQLYWTAFLNYSYHESIVYFVLIAFGFLTFLIGICFYIYDILVKKYEKECNSMQFQYIMLQNKQKTSSPFNMGFNYNQPNFLDIGDRTSICSAFSDNEESKDNKYSRI